MAHFDELRLDDIDRRLRAAMPGPWRCVPVAVNYFRIQGPNAPAFSGLYGKEADAEFVAHSRDDIEFLLEMVVRLGRAIRLAVSD